MGTSGKPIGEILSARLRTVYDRVRSWPNVAQYIRSPRSASGVADPHYLSVLAHDSMTLIHETTRARLDEGLRRIERGKLPPNHPDERKSVTLIQPALKPVRASSARIVNVTYNGRTFSGTAVDVAEVLAQLPSAKTA